MKKNHTGKKAALAAVFLVGATGYTLNAQTSQGRATAAASVPPNSHAHAAGADILASDPRLAVKVTLQKQDCELGSVLDRLTGMGHVTLTNGGVSPGRIAFSYHDMSLRGVLDSLASLCGGEWRRGPAASLVLASAYNSHELDPLRPHSQAEADEDAAGRPLPGELQQLSPQAMQALETGADQEAPGQPVGLAFADLPSAMQATLNQMQQAQLRVMAERGSTAFQNSDITNSRVTLSIDSNKQFTQYGVSFILPPKTVDGVTYSNSGTYGVGTTVYKDPRDQDHGITPALPAQDDARTDAADAQADAASRLTALQADPALKQRVSLTTDLASLSDTLTALGAKVSVTFAAPDQDGLHSAAYKGAALSDVLDDLATRYSTDNYRYSWGVRPSGVIVFHVHSTPQGAEAAQAKAQALVQALVQAELSGTAGTITGGQ